MTKMESSFAEHADAIWSQIAKALEDHFLESKDWVHERLVLGDGEWKVALDFHEHAGYLSKATYTRFHAPYLSDNRFCFTLRHETLEDRVGKLFGLQDIQVGDAEFDPKFLIQSNFEERFKTILGRERLRELLLEEPHALLQLHGDHGYWDDHYAPTTRDVSIEVAGQIKDVERLKRLFDILTEVLNGMCDTHDQLE